jgi:large subunit ribosomal protein L4
MELKLTTDSGEASTETVEVSEAAFNRDFNEALIHQVVTAYMATGRAGSKAQKSRSAVSGGGAKPWRQKGTGRARSGTIRSPIWRSGGVTFAASKRDFSQKVNRKMYRAAMTSIVSELARQERLVILADFSMDAPKTRDMAVRLKVLGAEKALIVTEEFEQNVYLSSRNLINIDYTDAAHINPVNMVHSEKIIITTGAIKKVEEMLK